MGFQRLPVGNRESQGGAVNTTVWLLVGDRKSKLGAQRNGTIQRRLERVAHYITSRFRQCDCIIGTFANSSELDDSIGAAISQANHIA